MRAACALPGSVWPERHGERVLAVLRARCEGGPGGDHLHGRSLVSERVSDECRLPPVRADLRATIATSISKVLRGRSVDLVAEFGTGRYVLGRHQTANNRLELLPVSSFFTTVCEDLGG